VKTWLCLINGKDKGNGNARLPEMTYINFSINFRLMRVWPLRVMQQPKAFVFFFFTLNSPPRLPHSLLHFQQ
jgi:hypothetical protein